MLLTWILIFYQIFVASSSSCFKQGLCLGKQIKIKDSSNEFECLKKCKDVSNCFWASFHQSDQKCILFATCSSVADLDQYTFARKSCQRLVMNVGGNYATGNKVEVNDLYNSDFQCSISLDSCDKLYGAFGGFVNKIPTVCGGNCHHSNGTYQSSKTCFQLQEKSFQPMQVPILAETVYNPAYAQVGDGLLYANNDYVRKVSDDNSDANYSQMPFSLERNCMVRLDDGSLVIFNGRNKDQPTTASFIYNPEQNEWISGPVSSPPRYALACGILNQKSNGRTYIVTAGGFLENGNFLNVSRCVDVTDGINSSLEMFDCPDLPENLAGSRIISDEENGQIFLIGGGNITSPSTHMYMLEDVGKDWQKIGQLQDGRSHSVSFFLDDYEMKC